MQRLLYLVAYGDMILIDNFIQSYTDEIMSEQSTGKKSWQTPALIKLNVTQTAFGIYNPTEKKVYISMPGPYTTLYRNYGPPMSS